MRPTAVSTTRRPLPSPKPQTMRSGLVGISLRWRLAMRPSASMIATLLKSVLLAGARSISLKPGDDDDAAARAMSRSGAQAVAAEIDGVGGERAVQLVREPPCRRRGAGARSRSGSPGSQASGKTTSAAPPSAASADQLDGARQAAPRGRGRPAGAGRRRP